MVGWATFAYNMQYFICCNQDFSKLYLSKKRIRFQLKMQDSRDMLQVDMDRRLEELCLCLIASSDHRNSASAVCGVVICTIKEGGPGTN